VDFGSPAGPTPPDSPTAGQASDHVLCCPGHFSIPLQRIPRILDRNLRPAKTPYGRANSPGNPPIIPAAFLSRESPSMSDTSTHVHFISPSLLFIINRHPLNKPTAPATQAIKGGSKTIAT
jgi:hypothetical protein